METFRFHIIDSKGDTRWVEIRARNLAEAQKRLYRKYNPLTVYGNNF
jgi:type II secretory pathway component PulF